MSTPMPWQEDHTHPVKLTNKIFIRWGTEWGIDLHPLAPLDVPHLVESTSANDTEDRHAISLSSRRSLVSVRTSTGNAAANCPQAACASCPRLSRMVAMIPLSSRA